MYKKTFLIFLNHLSNHKKVRTWRKKGIEKIASLPRGEGEMKNLLTFWFLKKAHQLLIGDITGVR